MARHIPRVAAAAVVALAMRTALSQESPADNPKGPPPHPGKPALSGSGHPPGEHPQRGPGIELREIGRFVDSLPADTREVVRQHFQEWLKMRTALHSGIGKPTPDSEEAKRFLDRLPPEQRERFKANLQRWQNMPPDEREALRLRDEIRQRQVHQEVERLLQESGLQLDGEKRDQFMRAYSQERRAIEDKLQKEIAEKRAPLVKELADRLRAEFGTEATPGSGAQK